MRDHVNPWLALPSNPPYMLECDKAAICAYNAQAHEMHRLQLDSMPEPFIGNTKAPVVLLSLNPGFNEQGPKIHADPRFQDLLRNNYCQRKSDYPFYFLDPRIESPGRDWWEQKLKSLLAIFSREKLAESILCVEYFPYPSEKFCTRTPEVPSQEFGFSLVRSAIARGAVVVVMRARKPWIKRVPELERYSRALLLNSYLNVVVSPRNCSGFDVVVSAIRAKKDHA
jgi:hypothetical protein